MLVKNKHQRKCVRGKGFTDVLRNVGSYVAENKDLITKPLLGAAGDLVAYGLTQGGKALLNRILTKPNLDAKSKEILQQITGSGLKRF